MKMQRVTVNKNQRALLLRNGDFQRVLRPGTHWLFDGFDQLSVVVFALEQPAFEHPLAEYLMAREPEVVAAEFVRVVVGETQVGLRSEDGRLVEVLAPGTRRLYWKGLAEVQVELIDIAESALVTLALLHRLTQTRLRARANSGVALALIEQVPENHVGVLRIDGKVEALLPAGPHGYWRFNRNVSLELVDLRLQALEVSGQEILTRDKVALRLNLSATWRYGDVLEAYTHLAKPAEHLYRELQLGLRAAVGERTLDELLENKAVIDEVVTAFVVARVAGQGLVLEGVGVKDIVLPGEMKTILARVVEAQKTAEANVIRRREETAATRSLLNTAKVMEGNPIALRMKELETLERVAERIDKISVFGGLDQVLDGLVKLR